MSSRVPLTPYQKHKASWKHCERCELSKRRVHVCLYRGVLPCDVLFIGEAPGESEDTVGKPMIGPAGRYLDWIIRSASSSTARRNVTWTWGITNVLGCLPTNEEMEKLNSWEDWELEWTEECAPRLVEIVRIANPKLIVAVGRAAEERIRQDYVGNPTFHKKIPRVSITHPAAILRGPVASRNFSLQKQAVTVEDAILEKIR